MSLLGRIGGAIARAVRRAVKALANRAGGIIRKAVGFVLFVPRAVVAGLFPSVAQRMAEMAAEEEAKKAAAGPSPVAEQDTEELDDSSAEQDLSGPDESVEAPRISSEAQEPEVQRESLVQRFKNTLTNIRDDLFSRTEVTSQSLTAEAPKGLGISPQAANDLSQGAAPVREKLAAAAPAAPAVDTPPPRQEASNKGQRLG